VAGASGAGFTDPLAVRTAERPSGGGLRGDDDHRARGGSGVVTADRRGLVRLHGENLGHSRLRVLDRVLKGGHVVGIDRLFLGRHLCLKIFELQHRREHLACTTPEPLIRMPEDGVISQPCRAILRNITAVETDMLQLTGHYENARTKKAAAALRSRSSKLYCWGI
jgi:hypothetical protein